MKKSIWTALPTLSAAIVAGLLLNLGLAAPANANETTLSGSAYENEWYAYQTARTNTWAKNEVWYSTQGAGGGSLAIGLLHSGGSVPFAQGAQGWGGTQETVYENGNPWVGYGTFYIAVYIETQCGGSGCGLIPWTADFWYNVYY